MKVTVVDYKGGLIETYLGDRSYHWIQYIDGQSITIESSTTLIMPLSYIPWLEDVVDVANDSRLLLWDIHPYNLIEQTALSGLYKALPKHFAHKSLSLLEPTRRQKIAKLVDIGLARNGVAFMCQKNYFYNMEMFGLSEDEPNYLPIAIEKPRISKPPQTEIINQKFNVQKFDIACLSRLDFDKLQPILQLMFDVDCFNQRSFKPHKSRLALHIIGNGNADERIKQFAKSLDLRLEMPGRLDGDELSDYLFKNVDVGFAMGTSALEFAIRGIPTILTRGGEFHASYKQGGLHYQWLFKANGYDVTAEKLSDSQELVCFDEIIESIYCVERYLDLSHHCEAYATKNHELSHVAHRLLEMLNESTFSYVDLQRSGILDDTFYEKCLFSLKGMYKTLKFNIPENNAR